MANVRMLGSEILVHGLLLILTLASSLSPPAVACCVHAMLSHALIVFRRGRPAHQVLVPPPGARSPSKFRSWLYLRLRLRLRLRLLLLRLLLFHHAVDLLVHGVDAEDRVDRGGLMQRGELLKHICRHAHRCGPRAHEHAEARGRRRAWGAGAQGGEWALPSSCCGSTLKPRV